MFDHSHSKIEHIAVLSSASHGGGGIAANRLATTLAHNSGINTSFLTANEFGGLLPPEVAPTESVSNKGMSDAHYTIEYPGYKRPWVIDYLSSFDIINIHWACYLISLAELDTLSQMGQRMLFMLHDFHYTTGGCHYPAGCTGMTRGCYNCPQVDHQKCDATFVPINLRIKQGIFARPNVHIAAPSQFLCDQVSASGIIPTSRTHVLRNPYVPLAPKIERDPNGITRILLIADSLLERRKGMALALDSLIRLKERLGAEQQVRLDIVGTPDETLQHKLNSLDIPHRFYGRITDHKTLVDIYAACHVVLTCSFEDNWPNILVEAGAYGCIPVVGPGHGCAEFIDIYKYGAISQSYHPDDFALALHNVIIDMHAGNIRDIAQVQSEIRKDHEVDHIARRFLEIVRQIHP